MKNDPLVMFKYRDTYGTHAAEVTTQSKMMQTLKSTCITWAVVENLRTGEIRYCTDDKLAWKKPSPKMDILINPHKQEAFWYGDNNYLRHIYEDKIAKAKTFGML